MNLTAPDPLSDQCQDTNPTDGSTFHSHFFNERRSSNDGNPFQVDAYIPATAKTCPDPATFGPANGIRDPNGLAGRLHARPGAPLLPGAVPARRRQAGPLHDGQRRARPHAGLLRHAAAPDLPLPAPRRASPLRDLGRVLPVGLRRLVPEPPVADRRAHAVLARRARRPGPTITTRSRTRTGCRSNYPFYKATGPSADSSLTESCPSTPAQHDNPPRDPAHANSVCGDWAVNTTQPFSQPYSPGTAPTRRLPAAELPDDRRPAQRRRPVMGVVRGRLVERGRTGRRARLDERHGPVPRGTNANGCPDPNSKANAQWPFCPDNLFQFHHQPFNYYAPYARTGANGDGPRPAAGCRTSATSRSSSRTPVIAQALRAARRLVHQAGRGRERAPRLRERAERQQPSRRPAEGGRGEPVPQGHDGDRDLRRVRRPVGPHAASGPGRHVRAARRLGPRHAHPGADDRAGDQGQVRRGPREARHDVDHGHDRASLRSAARELARRGGA